MRDSTLTKKNSLYFIKFFINKLINFFIEKVGGTAVAINYTMKKMMDIQEGDCYFSTSDIGWVVGHTFIIYGIFLIKYIRFQVQF